MRANPTQSSLRSSTPLPVRRRCSIPLLVIIMLLARVSAIQGRTFLKANTTQSSLRSSTPLPIRPKSVVPLLEIHVTGNRVPWRGAASIFSLRSFAMGHYRLVGVIYFLMVVRRINGHGSPSLLYQEQGTFFFYSRLLFVWCLIIDWLVKLAAITFKHSLKGVASSAPSWRCALVGQSMTVVFPTAEDKPWRSTTHRLSMDLSPVKFYFPCCALTGW